MVTKTLLFIKMTRKMIPKDTENLKEIDCKSSGKQTYNATYKLCSPLPIVTMGIALKIEQINLRQSRLAPM